MPRSQEDILNQNLAGQPITVNNFAGNFSPTLGSPNFVCPNGNVESPFGSQSLGLTGPTLSSGSLAASTLHRTKGKARRREHVIAENVPGPESCVWTDLVTSQIKWYCDYISDGDENCVVFCLIGLRISCQSCVCYGFVGSRCKKSREYVFILVLVRMKVNGKGVSV